VEDTLRPMVDEPLPEILVTAPRQTLDEILRHVVEGEAQRDSLLRDQAYTALVRVMGRDKREAPDAQARLLYESVDRIYQERPDKHRVIRLREWSWDDGKRGGEEEQKGGQTLRAEMRRGGESGAQAETEVRIEGGGGHDDGVQVDYGSDMSEQFVAFAFDPKARSLYRFRIEDRKILGDNVVYVLAFEPRSPLEPLPRGRVWVNTNDFVILREEISFNHKSPLPLLIESVDSCVIERTRVDRRYWVVSRILARVTLTDPVRWAARLSGTKLPKVVDFAFSRTDWIINGDIPDSLFAPTGGAE